MTSLVSSAVRVKPATSRVLRYSPATATLTIIVTAGRSVIEAAYSLEHIGSDFGDGYRLTKHVGHADDEADIYHVHLSDDGHTCDCKSGTYRGRCKHVDALLKLRSLGKL